MTASRAFPRSLFEDDDDAPDGNNDTNVLYKLASIFSGGVQRETVDEDPASHLQTRHGSHARSVSPAYVESTELYKLATPIGDGDVETEWEEESRVAGEPEDQGELYQLARPVSEASFSDSQSRNERDGSPSASSVSSSSRDPSPRQIATRSQTVGIQTRHKKRDNPYFKSPSVGPPPVKRNKRPPPTAQQQQEQQQRKKRKLSEPSTNGEEGKNDNKTTSNKRGWELWCPADKDAFFEGLGEYGKDFEKLHKHVVAKRMKLGEGQTKTKNQIRFFYYRQWQKLSKLVKLESFPSDVKKDVQELTVLINYGEMRKKCGNANFLNDKRAIKFNELIFKGQTTLKIGGKFVRLKTPVTRVLKKTTDDPDGVGGRVDDQEVEVLKPLPPLPSYIKITLRPKMNGDHSYVHQICEQNPFLKIDVTPEKSVKSVIEFLERKWKPAEGKLKGREAPKIRLHPLPNAAFTLFELEKGKKAKEEAAKVAKDGSQKPVNGCTDTTLDKEGESTSIPMPSINTNGESVPAAPINGHAEGSEAAVPGLINVRSKPKAKRPRTSSERSDKSVEEQPFENISWSSSDCGNVLIGDLFVMLQTPPILQLQYSFDETALTKTSTEGTLYQYKDKQFALALSRLLNVASIEYVNEKERSKQDFLGKTTCKQCGSIKSQGPLNSPSASGKGSPSTSGNARRRVTKADGCPTTPKGRKAPLANFNNSPSTSATNGNHEGNDGTSAVNPIFAIPTAIPLKTKGNPHGRSGSTAGSTFKELQYAEALAYKEQIDSLKRSQEVIQATKIRNRPSSNRKPIIVQRMLTSQPNVVGTAASAPGMVGIHQGNYVSISLMPVSSAIEAAPVGNVDTTSMTPTSNILVNTGDILQSALAAAAIPSAGTDADGLVPINFDAPVPTTCDPNSVAAGEKQYASTEPVISQENDAQVPNEPTDSPNLSALLNDVSLPNPESFGNTSFTDIIEGKSQTSFSEALMLPRPTRQSSPKKYSTELEFLPKTPTKNGGREAKDQLLETPFKSIGLETPTKSSIETPRKLFETPYKNSDSLLSSWFGNSEDLTVTDSNLPNLLMMEDSNPPQQQQPPQTRSASKSHASNGKGEPATISTPSSSSSSSSSTILLRDCLNENSRDSIISNSSVDFSLQSLLNENSMDYVNKFADLASHITGNNSQNLETPKKNK